MSKQLFRDAVGWGVILWLIGYILGIIFFMMLPYWLIGWVIMPIGILITIWVLKNKIHGDSKRYYRFLALVWTLIAIVFDYFFLVNVFNPADGYYKLDVYIYYLATFSLPLIFASHKKLKE